jgi:hypothetical protein
MTVLTILNQGTYNSTNVNTSEGYVLVISRLAQLIHGAQDFDWMLNEGAGTKELRHQQGVSGSAVRSGSFKGLMGGEGVEENVERAVEFVERRLKQINDQVTVNLAGHSRGSVTCYKIARALRDDPSPKLSKLKLNIFAIDPVPGNTGFLSKENFKNIALGGNVENSFLMLAESEHRLIFRPYVDALYSVGLPNHRFDTVPGTHGGINMLDGPEKESAAIVLSHALEFLMENGTQFNEREVSACKLSDEEKLELYSSMMMRIRKYKWRASMWNLAEANLFTGGIQVDKHRIANVYGPKDEWAWQGDQNARRRTKKDHHGLNLGEAIGRMTGDAAHASRAHRFFANREHEELFAQTYPGAFEAARALERKGVTKDDKATLRKVLSTHCNASRDAMSGSVREHFEGFCAERGVA